MWGDGTYGGFFQHPVELAFSRSRPFSAHLLHIPFLDTRTSRDTNRPHSAWTKVIRFSYKNVLFSEVSCIIELHVRRIRPDIWSTVISSAVALTSAERESPHRPFFVCDGQETAQCRGQRVITYTHGLLII